MFSCYYCLFFLFENVCVLSYKANSILFDDFGLIVARFQYFEKEDIS